jgi:prolipoprotein diacylglyceryl transferase
MEQLFIHWNVSPTIFDFGILQIRYYGILWALALIVSYILFNRFFKEEGWSQELLDKLTMYVVLGTILGARLGHCFFYEPDYYLSHPLEIIMIWQGGLASHGAAIGIVTSLFLFHYKEKQVPLWWLFDRIAIAVAISGCLIRLGNLMNSEIYGTETTLPWGFIFEHNREYLPKHPTQIYEALAYLALFLVLLFIYKKKRKTMPGGLLFGIFVTVLFTSRFLIEYIKNPQTEFEVGMALNMGQLLSIPFIIGGIVIVIWTLLKAKKV